ncbi:hypothetical protein AmDm5_2470 [Acetobacter malorum]|nr:hypothetical protein AmDm5_2470 [Acetobacter malorum]
MLPRLAVAVRVEGALVEFGFVSARSMLGEIPPVALAGWKMSP